MLVIKKLFVLIIIALIICPVNVAANNGNGQSQPNGKKNGELPRPVLAVTPREIDLGTIGFGETVSGTFTLKNMRSWIMDWRYSRLAR